MTLARARLGISGDGKRVICLKPDRVEGAGGKPLLQLQRPGGDDLPLTRKLWPFQTNSFWGFPTGAWELRSPGGDVGAVIRLREGSPSSISEEEKREEVRYTVSGTLWRQEPSLTALS